MVEGAGEGSCIADEPKKPAQMRVRMPAGAGEDEGEDLDTLVGIELRGSSSMGFPKKGFGLEAWEPGSDDVRFRFRAGACRCPWSSQLSALRIWHVSGGGSRRRSHTATDELQLRQRHT